MEKYLIRIVPSVYTQEKLIILIIYIFQAAKFGLPCTFKKNI